MSDFIKLPKLELHLHLEGAAPPAFIRGLAQRKGVDLSSIFDDHGAYNYTGFVDFLRVYEAACTVLTTPQDFHDLTLAVLEHSAAHGVIYSEAFLSPDFCGGGDLSAWRDYLAAIQTAAPRRQRRRWVSPCAAALPASGISGQSKPVSSRPARRKLRAISSLASASRAMRTRANWPISPTALTPRAKQGWA